MYTLLPVRLAVLIFENCVISNLTTWRF